MKLAQKHLVQTVSIFGSLLLLAGKPAFAQAQPTLRSRFPGRRISDSLRCPCGPHQPVVAIIPPGNIAVVASDRPAMHFVVPDFDSYYMANFTLFDAQNKVVYEKSMSADEVENLVSIYLPQSSLSMVQPYRWMFSVAYGEERYSQSAVYGGIQQVSSGNVEQISWNVDIEDWSTALTVAEDYQRLGFQSEAITVLVELYRRHPDVPEVQQAWQHLLRDLKVEAFVVFSA